MMGLGALVACISHPTLAICNTSSSAHSITSSYSSRATTLASSASSRSATNSEGTSLSPAARRRRCAWPCPTPVQLLGPLQARVQSAW